MRHLAPLALLALLPLQAALPALPDAPQPPCCITAIAPAPAPLSGRWTLAWDDTTDLELAARDKVCRVELTDRHGALVGRFVGPVLGRERAAVFTGEVLPGGPAQLVSLVQREEGYSCAYLLTRTGPARLAGTWRDSRGAGGTVELVRARAREDGADVIVTGD